MKSFPSLPLLGVIALTIGSAGLHGQTAPQVPPRIRPTAPPGQTVPGVTPPPLPAAPNAAAAAAAVAADKPAAAPAPPSSGKYYIDYPAAPLAEVLEDYYVATKRRVLRDRGLESATVSIEVPGEFSAEEYQSIIEKGLLMHGYAFVPSGDNLYKLVAAEQGASPSSHGVPVILRSEDLPETDQVVSHVIQLNFLQAEEAAAALQQLIPLHPYGKILAMANARSLVVTEASQTIRAYLDLVKQVDVPPMDTVQKTFVLQRSTPSEVVEQLNALLGLGGSGGAASPRSAPAATQGAAKPPGAAPAVAGAQAAAAGTSASMAGQGGATPEASQPIIQAIERTNSLLVVARPVDMQRIEDLIRELDAESDTRRYFSRRLNYLDLSVFLGIAEKALQRNSNTSGQGLQTTQNNRTGTTAPTNNNNTLGNNSGFNSGLNSGLGSGLGGSSGSSSFSGSGASPQLDITTKPLSVLIANTLVIADPASSKFFASGPPDQIQALEELADELDVRPRQIYLSAIIGEFTLGDDFNFGLDWVQTLKSTGENSGVAGVLNTQGTAFADPANLRDVGTFLANGPAGLAGLTAYGQINQSLNVFLQTLESTRRFHVLQKPTVTTLNHQPASIYIGQQIAIAGQTFTNGAAGNNGLGFTSTTQYIPVRLQLDITPHIFNDTEIMLEFKQQNNDISGFNTIGGNRVPNISEQGMSNSLIVPDRATAMLGGLITERDTKNNSGLPFLVRIPLIKHLFGSTNNTKERRELMIFVQPRILPDEQTQMLEQARMSDQSANFEQTAAFGGSPEDVVPRAIPAGEIPNDLLPAPAVDDQPKKTFMGKIKGLFQRKDTE